MKSNTKTFDDPSNGLDDEAKTKNQEPRSIQMEGKVDHRW